MSDSTPDLSKVISLIMENPRLIEEISGMLKKSEGEATAEVEKKPEDTVSETKEAAALPSPEPAKSFGTRQNRRELMSALKPYVSESRRRALDSFMSIADILEMMRSR